MSVNGFKVNNTVEKYNYRSLDNLPNLDGAIAEEYSSTKPYSVGDYVWYNGTLKRCIFDILSPEEYTASHWETARVAKDFGNTRREIEYQEKKVLLNRVDGELNGITYKWNGEVCEVTGTATSNSVLNLISPHSSLPGFIKPGTVLRCIYEATSTTIPLSIVWFDSNSNATYTYISETQCITVPSTAVKWSLRIYVASGASMGTNGQRVNKIQITVQDGVEKLFSGNVPSNILDNKLSGLGPNSATWEGVTYLKSNDCTWSASGSLAASKTSILNVCYDKVNFPTGFSAGGTYAVMLRLADPTSLYYLRAVTYTSSSDNGTAVLEAFINNGYCLGVFTIPSNATGIAIRAQRMNTTSSAVTINDSLEFFCLDVGSKEGAFLRDAIAAISGNVNAKLLSIGNSFMTGSVWRNNAYDHLVSFENSVYGQIAMSMCIPQANVRNELYSSTGLVSAPTSGDNGSFMDIITARNLTSYDYLVTLFNSTDISNNALGTANATDNDGTLAGAVIHLVNYITSSNGKCKLILLSVPPYSSDPAKSGVNTFSGNWPYGYSIGDLDAVMAQLAKKHHFVYVSWQDNPMSYHYTDYMDILSGSTGIRHANDDSVYRAMGEYAALQVHSENNSAFLGVNHWKMGSVFPVGSIVNYNGVLYNAYNNSNVDGREYALTNTSIVDEILSLKRTLPDGVNILPILSNKDTKSNNGITYSWVDDTTIRMNGTASAESFYNFIISRQQMIPGISPGDDVLVKINNMAYGASVMVYYYTGGTTTTQVLTYTAFTRLIRIPDDATGLMFRIIVPSGTVISNVDTKIELIVKPQIKHIRALFIGNSYTNDCVNYAPFIAEGLSKNVAFTIGTTYYSGASINDYIDWFDNDTATLTYYKKNGLFPKWNAGVANRTLKQCIADEPWDIIVFQQSSSDQGTWSTFSNLNTLINKVLSYNATLRSKAVKIGWMFPQLRYSIIDSTTYANVVECVQNVLNTTPIEFFIPCGTAVQNARGTSLDSIGDSSHLCADSNGHLQAGLPSLIPAYVTALKLLELAGEPWHGILQETTRPTATWVTNIISPGENGTSTGVTDANCYLAQKCAVAAMKFPTTVSTIS